MLLHEPTSIHDATRVLADDEFGTKVIAGGTAVVLMMQQGLIQPEALVSLDRITGLKYIELQEGQLNIGARTTLQEIATDATVNEHFPSLGYACRRVANIRIRNAATLGGNLAEADYASDPPSALIALRASVEITGVDGYRSSSVEDLLTGFYTTTLEPSEIITSISVPVRNLSRSRDVYLKFLSRSSEDRPCVGVAVNAIFRADDRETVEDIRVVVGAAAATPQRFPEAEQLAVGTDLNPGVIQQVADAYAEQLDPLEDLRGTAWYRKQMTRTFVRRALDEVRNSIPRADQRG